MSDTWWGLLVGAPLWITLGAVLMYCWIYYGEVKKRRTHLSPRWKPQSRSGRAG